MARDGDDDDKSRQASSLQRGAATEASPLLGGLDGTNAGPTAALNGTLAPPGPPAPGSGVTAAGSGPEVEREAEREPEEETREGIPEMAKRLHVLLPAIGIGVFLCALDQLLAVATYARIGSDLGALNSTSWIATA